MKPVAAVSALLFLAACSSGGSSNGGNGSSTSANTPTTLSAAEIATNARALKDAKITSCGPNAAHKVEVKGTVHNATASTANFVVQITIASGAGKRLYATAASASDVAPAQTKAWDAATTATYAAGMTCKVTSVAVRTTP
jgi:hypothetical protein